MEKVEKAIPKTPRARAAANEALTLKSQFVNMKIQLDRINQIRDDGSQTMKSAKAKFKCCVQMLGYALQDLEYFAYTDRAGSDLL